MKQLKLFTDDFKVGEKVLIVSKSLADCKLHDTYDTIDRISIYPKEYYHRTAENYPDAVPKVGEAYYVIDGYYYLKKDLKKVV